MASFAYEDGVRIEEDLKDVNNCKPLFCDNEKIGNLFLYNVKKAKGRLIVPGTEIEVDYGEDTQDLVPVNFLKIGGKYYYCCQIQYSGPGHVFSCVCNIKNNKFEIFNKDNGNSKK